MVWIISIEGQMRNKNKYIFYPCQYKMYILWKEGLKSHGQQFNMSIRRLLFQWATTIKIQLLVSVLVGPDLLLLKYRAPVDQGGRGIFLPKIFLRWNFAYVVQL